MRRRKKFVYIPRTTIGFANAGPDEGVGFNSSARNPQSVCCLDDERHVANLNPSRKVEN